MTFFVIIRNLIFHFQFRAFFRLDLSLKNTLINIFSSTIVEFLVRVLKKNRHEFI